MLNDMTFDAPAPKPVVCDEHGPTCIGHAIRIPRTPEEYAAPDVQAHVAVESAIWAANARIAQAYADGLMSWDEFLDESTHNALTIASA